MSDLGHQEPGIRPENIIWVFGTSRTGSSWLTFMMGSLPDHSRWNEPLVGYLFAHLYYDRGKHRAATKHFILGDEYRSDSIRNFVLGAATARFPEAADGYLVIKEPHGSMGAPLLMDAMPESRMILLVRDPRDVIASALDAQREGSRNVKEFWGREPRQHGLVEEDPDAFVKKRSHAYRQDIRRSWKAYRFHEGRKSLVRYEDLKADTLGTMKRIYESLETSVDEGELSRVVEKYAWENIPEAEKGEGKIRRKATPGGWREDLTEEQIKIVEETTTSMLEKFYPEAGVAG